MQYLMLVNVDEKAAAVQHESVLKQVTEEHMKFNQAGIQAGKILIGDRLQLSKEAVRLRERDGKLTITDGPFSEAKEVLGGYWMLNCDNRDDALSWASRSPAAKYGTCDVREVSGSAFLPKSGEVRMGQPGANGKQRWMALILGENKSFERFSKDMDRVDEESGAFVEKLDAAKISWEGARLQHERSAFQVNVRNGKATVTDGPFSEAKEALGGYMLIEVDSKAQAIEWFSKFPGTRYGTIELRQTWPVRP